MTVQEWLGTDNTLGIDIWKNKYRYQDETFDEWLDRITGKDEELKQKIIEKKFLFGGRTLASRNTGNGMSFSNCYSSGYVPDSIEGIMELNKNLALTYQASGGQGLSLSLVRPKGASVRGGVFKSDGIVPFMEIFNQTTASISQGGSRKGALLMSLSIWHPEIETFISIKDGTNKITKANLSVEIDDDFMNLVKNGVTEYKYVHSLFGEEYTINPVELYNKIMKKAWSSAEPGVIFTNRFRNYNLMELHDEYKIITGNPCGEQPLPKNGACLTYNTLITTPEGTRKLGELKTLQVLGTDDRIHNYEYVKNQGEKMVYTVKLSNGLKLEGTEDHLLQKKDGSFVKIIDSLGEDIKVLSNGSHMNIYGDNDEFAEMIGWIHGDGWYNKTIGISFNKLDGDYEIKDRILKEFINYFEVSAKPLKDDEVSFQLQTDKSISLIKANDLGMTQGLHKEKKMPKIFYSWSDKQQRSFVRGLFTADGSVSGKANSQIYYSSSSICLIEELQNYLSSIGIHSTVYKTEFKTVDRNAQYRLAITKESARLFMKTIGFSSEYKNSKFNWNSPLYKDKDSYKVVEVLEKGTETVYDIIEVSNINTFYANGVAVHNCNLGSVNLAEYVVNPFTEHVQFDFDEFDKDVRLFVKALDDVLNEGMELHALKEQRDMAKNYRNIGLGIMGYATMLMSMGIEYGSYDAKLLTDNIMSVMINSAATASAYLAQLNGTFPKYNNKIIEGKFYHKALNGDTMDLINQYGLRNCSLLSVAPSGSIGTMLNVSTGLEPYYALTYQRKTESLHGDKDVYYTVEVDTAKKAREAYGDTVCVSAMDIDWHDRVEVQGIMQKYVDTAISSTVNVPEETTIEQLRDLYLFAWEKGLKGITIYREGSFEAILTTKDKKEKVIKEEIKRGVMDKVPSDTIYIPRDMINGCGRAKVMIGFSPSENRVTDIYYIAKGQGGCSKNIQGEAILISQVLRLGGNLADIQKSFAGIDACSSCTLARTKGIEISGKNCPNILLKMVLELQQEMQKETITIPKIENKKNNDTIKLQANIDKKMICPECGATLTPIGGCYTCNECGYSKCD